MITGVAGTTTGTSRGSLAVDDVVLTGVRRRVAAPPAYTVVRAERGDLVAHRALRHDAFVVEQGLFAATDRDDVDDDSRSVVLVARTPDGTVLGGVRVAPALPPGPAGRDLGWWRGSRLVVDPAARASGASGAASAAGAVGVATALVRAACALAEQQGALRFDACVQARHTELFTRLGWVVREAVDLRGAPHVAVDWPIGRIQRLVATTKAALGGLLPELTGPAGAGGPTGFLGDDGVPVAGTDVVAACDAILPSMVERDPEWAGWCAVLVNLNDLAAMGAAPTGLLDAVGARDASFARRVLRGLGEASRAWDVPVLGGHTQLGVPASLAVTALGRTATPVPGGGGRPGMAVRVTADLGGGWRPGYTGGQWDSSSHRTGAELRALGDVVPALAPAAAKDVSMSGLVGTVGMLAEASGCGAVLDVAQVPSPAAAGAGDWLTCFPGFAVVTADTPGSAPVRVLPGSVSPATCGELVAGSGVGLRWPDGVVTGAVSSSVTGLGVAS